MLRAAGETKRQLPQLPPKFEPALRHQLAPSLAPCRGISLSYQSKRRRKCCSSQTKACSWTGVKLLGDVDLFMIPVGLIAVNRMSLNVHVKGMQPLLLGVIFVSLQRQLPQGRRLSRRKYRELAKANGPDGQVVLDRPRSAAAH